METGLKLASSIRFVYSKQNQTQKTVNISPTAVQKKTPGRKQSESTITRKKTATENAAENKSLKLEWGKAYKHINENKEAVNQIFIDMSQTESCRGDPYYLKIMREMAYGIFPRGIFYDRNRCSLVCNENVGKRNELVRRQRINKFIRVCLPGRDPLAEVEKTITVTNTQTEPLDETKINYRFFNRSLQKGDLSLVEGLEILKGSLETLFKEVKLFMYVNMEIISPKDELFLQDDTQHVIQNSNYVNNLRTPQPWKRLNTMERISLIGIYCTVTYLKDLGKTIDELTKQQAIKLRAIKESVISMYQIGLIGDSHVSYESGVVQSITGISITSAGIRILENINESRKTQYPDEVNIQPILIQKYKNVDLQKINNGVQKQDAKQNKMIMEMTDKD